MTGAEEVQDQEEDHHLIQVVVVEIVVPADQDPAVIAGEVAVAAVAIALAQETDIRITTVQNVVTTMTTTTNQDARESDLRFF
jgi:hypothetical protein